MKSETRRNTGLPEERVQELTVALERMGDGFLACDAGWRLVHLNPAAEKIFAVSRDDVTGNNLWEVLPFTRGSCLGQGYRGVAVGEGRFRLLFEHHRAIMLLVDPVTGHPEDVNPAVTRFYGFSREEMQKMALSQGNTILRLSAPDMP